MGVGAADGLGLVGTAVGEPVGSIVGSDVGGCVSKVGWGDGLPGTEPAQYEFRPVKVQTSLTVDGSLSSHLRFEP